MPKVTSSIGPQERNPAAIDRHVRAALHAGSSLYHLDSELLEHLLPDLIVTQELCAVCAVSYEIVARAAKRLRSDPRVVSLEPRSLDDVLATIALLGELTNRGVEARAVVSMLQTRAAALYERGSAGATRLRTLVLEWTDPPMSAGHWIPGLVELAGGEPLLANPGANSQRLSGIRSPRRNPRPSSLHRAVSISMQPCKRSRRSTPCRSGARFRRAAAGGSWRWTATRI